MAVSKRPQANETWIEKAKEHLMRLRAEAEEHSEAYDSYPTDKSFETALNILETLQSAIPPRIGLTQNSEIVLLWKSSCEEFRAYVKTDGNVEYIHNSEIVGRPCFARDLTLSFA
jgi:hypothetical protein